MPFHVCPGTSSWNSIAGRTDNALANLAGAASAGRKHGAIGYLNTDWGDGGHHQYLPVSYLGFVAGAAYSWGGEANQDLDLRAALSTHVFRDAAGVMGRVVYDLGNVYRAVGREPHNGSALNTLLLAPLGDRGAVEGITGEGLAAARESVDAAAEPLERARMDIDDAGLVVDESHGRQTASRLPDGPRAAGGAGRVRGSRRDGSSRGRAPAALAGPEPTGRSRRQCQAAPRPHPGPEVIRVLRPVPVQNCAH